MALSVAIIRISERLEAKHLDSVWEAAWTPIEIFGKLKQGKVSPEWVISVLSEQHIYFVGTRFLVESGRLFSNHPAHW